jgi:hypothetical protein
MNILQKYKDKGSRKGRGDLAQRSQRKFALLHFPKEPFLLIVVANLN